MTTTQSDRFWTKVSKGGSDDCWLWQASKTSDGYGMFSRAGRGNGRAYAHRVAWEMHVGPIPTGLEIDHLCRVRHCVNPAHLEPVTHVENMKRQAKAVATTCPLGHPYGPKNRYGRRCPTCSNKRRFQKKIENGADVNAARRKGTLWESAIVAFLNERGWPYAERRAQRGAQDRGDITGIPGGPVIEAKSAARFQLAEWMKETEAEVKNASAPFGVMWIKRPGKSSPADGYVVMSGTAFAHLLKAGGY